MNNFFLSLGFIVAIGTCVVELIDFSNKRTGSIQNLALNVEES